MRLEGALFGVSAAGVVACLRVVQQLYDPAGSAYNVDRALGEMISGLEAELDDRLRDDLADEADAPTPDSELALEAA